MTAYDRLDLLFQQNNGIVKTAQVLEIGIAKSTFYAYAKQRRPLIPPRPRMAFMFRQMHGRTPCTCYTFVVRRLYSPMRARCFSMT